MPDKLDDLIKTIKDREEQSRDYESQTRREMQEVRGSVQAMAEFL